MADAEQDARLVLDGRPLSVCQPPQVTRTAGGQQEASLGVLTSGRRDGSLIT